jgi:charged multivesicular body protein 2A
MSFLFGGKQKTPEGIASNLIDVLPFEIHRDSFSEVMKEYKRGIDRSVREMDREVTRLQNQEKKLIIEMKKCAKDGQQMPVIQIKAKDLVRTRQMITKFYTMKSQMQSISLRLQTIKSTQVHFPKFSSPF